MVCFSRHKYVTSKLDDTEGEIGLGLGHMSPSIIINALDQKVSTFQFQAKNLKSTNVD